MGDILIRIVCTSERHPGREVHVEAFAPNGNYGAGWHSVHKTKARRLRGGRTTADSGQTLYGDTPWQRVDASDRDESNVAIRNRWILECRKCHAPITARGERLNEILDGFRKLGWDTVPLAVLAATMGRSQQ